MERAGEGRVPGGSAQPPGLGTKPNRNRFRQMDEDATFLREQAARCRRLAAGITTKDVAETLLRLAQDYEQRANEVDVREANR